MAVTARSPKAVSESIAEVYTGGRVVAGPPEPPADPTSRSFQDERCTNAAPEPVLYGRLFVAESRVRVSPSRRLPPDVPHALHARPAAQHPRSTPRCRDQRRGRAIRIMLGLLQTPPR